MSFETPNPPYNSNDQYATYLNTSCLDFLLIELVPMAYRIAAELALQEAQYRPASGTAARRASAGAGVTVAGSTAGTGGKAGSAAGGKLGQRDARGELVGSGVCGIGGSPGGVDEEELREAAYYRLETLGYRVGLGVAERFSRDRPRFTEPLDIIKFICKDLWSLIFRKQIDNLKTNHRGIFVLTDNNFKPIQRISMERGRDGMLAQTQAFLVFPAGIIRGALAAMGITATVTAESQELPAAAFQIRTVGAKA